MSKASILQLVTTFSNGDADSVAIDQYYDHVMEWLARFPYFVAATIINLTAEDGDYTLADNHVKISGMIYDDAVLDRMEERSLQMFNPSWRDEVGTPVAYTMDSEHAKTYRIYPKPRATSGDLLFLYGSPLGLDYPQYALVLFHTEIRQEVLPWMDLQVMCDVLAREYGHESNHRDDQVADFFKQLSHVLWQMVN